MNILYHVHRFPLPSFILNEIYELEQAGHSVAVFVLNEGSGYVEHDATKRVDARFCFADFTEPSSLSKILSPTLFTRGIIQETAFVTHPKYFARFLHLTKQCIEFIESLEREIDVIHGHFPTRAKLSAVATAEHQEIPCTVAAHGLSDLFTGQKQWMQRVFKRVDRITAISKYAQNTIRDLGIKTPTDIVHMGVRPEKFKPDEETVDQRLLTIARLVKKKGIKYAVDAVSKLEKEYPNLEYHIIGTGEQEEELQEIIDERGLEDRIKMLGFVDDQQLIRELNEAAIFVLPSIIAGNGERDGIPVALMESMAMEVPPITTNVTGIPELVDNRTNGVVVEPRNTTELIDNLNHLINNPEMQRKYGEAARQKVLAEFNSKKEAQKLVETFHKTVVQ
jgi:glycosyltransferase involved in cell wall biosynthesis